MVVVLKVDEEEEEFNMAIKVEKVNEEKKKGKVTILLKGANEVFANTIRRLVIEEVPTLAVEDLEIKDNSSALYDEMLALRLGLLPIKTDLKSYHLPKTPEEVEERSARCTLQLRLKAAKKGYVYAQEVESSDPKCTFVYPNMPVVKLLSKQKVDILMYAVMGRGKDHTKWCPGLAFYKREPLFSVGKVKDPESLAKQSTDGVLTLKGNSISVNKDKLYESNLLDYYAELDEAVKLEYSDNIIFTLESWGQLTTKEIFQESAKILIEKVEEMEQLL